MTDRNRKINYRMLGANHSYHSELVNAVARGTFSNLPDSFIVPKGHIFATTVITAHKTLDLSVVTVSNPSTNTEFNHDVGDEHSPHLVGGHFTLVTDVNAATRQVSLIVDIGGTDAQEQYSAITQIASLTRHYSFIAGLGVVPAAVSDGNRIMVAMGTDLYVPASHSVQSRVANMQAGDQIANIRLLYQERNSHIRPVRVRFTRNAFTFTVAVNNQLQLETPVYLENGTWVISVEHNDFNATLIEVDLLGSLYPIT